MTCMPFWTSSQSSLKNHKECRGCALSLAWISSDYSPSVIERRNRLEAIGWISGYTFCSSTAKTSTVTFIFCFMILMTTILPFNKKKYWQNPCSVFWPFHDLHDQRRRNLYHIPVRAWIREAFRLRWTKGLCKECGYDFSVSQESEHSFKSK